TYRLTDNIDAANTDDATVTVTVEAALIEANDDLIENVNGFAGATTGNVLGNDELNGALVNAGAVTITPNMNGPLTVNADGTVTI
ncbi:hypothetical protein, partial [Penaeicola halotolerans]|uniref:hypothetical protein n=1 Tax=Penaeicola halotolerans TaxID=2793196 RepID=UPI001CF919D4